VIRSPILSIAYIHFPSPCPALHLLHLIKLHQKHPSMDRTRALPTGPKYFGTAHKSSKALIQRVASDNTISRRPGQVPTAHSECAPLQLRSGKSAIRQTDAPSSTRIFIKTLLLSTTPSSTSPQKYLCLHLEKWQEDERSAFEVQTKGGCQ
jgi:hypothetical protein